MLWTEVVGYVASGLVAASLTLKNVRRLRLVNLVGAACFVVYAALIRSYPVVVVNAFIAVINVAYLVKLWRAGDAFELLAVPPDSPYLEHFVARHAPELARLYPAVGTDPRQALHEATCTLVLRNTLPVGLFAHRVEAGSKRALIVVDYVVPAYRDFKNARFLYAHVDEIFGGRAGDPGAPGDGKHPLPEEEVQEGQEVQAVQTLVTRATVPEHVQYLERVGFTRVAGTTDCFSREITTGA